jgi:hypothetical protein
MEYIKAEQFLEQSEEVQKVFLDWFNVNISDCDLVQDGDNIMLYKDYVRRWYTENDTYPLLTEGQLRHFIEDKTGCKLVLDYYQEDGYRIALYKSNIRHSEIIDRDFYNLVHDLLQAFWQVACIIAKEELKHE